MSDRVVIVYAKADCLNHPDPSHPGALTSGAEHHRSRSVGILDQQTAAATTSPLVAPEVTEHHEEYVEPAHSDQCMCGAEIGTTVQVFEWPPVPISGDNVRALADRTDGYVAFKMAPLAAAEDIDYRSFDNLKNFIYRKPWYLGFFDDRVVARTLQDNHRVWTGESIQMSELDQLLRWLVKTPVKTRNTPLATTLDRVHRQQPIDGTKITMSHESRFRGNPY